MERSMINLVIQKLREDLGDSYKETIHRICAVNYYRKVIDKLSTIYQDGVSRKVVNGTDSDQELLEWYEKELRLNSKLNVNNESYNAYMYSLLHIGLTDIDPITATRKPFIRTLPNHQFLVMNTSNYDPTEPNVKIIFNGVYDDKLTYVVYNGDEIIIMDSEGNLVRTLMEQRGIEDGVNDFGVDPFVYANDSQNLVMPLVQDDDLQMALLIPILFSDLNYAQKFQAFSVFVGIDVDDANIKLSPNHWISLKSDAAGVNPSFDTIKPTVDTDASIKSGTTQVGIWLGSKGIRPGTVGDGVDSFSSGISKMIDEADTFESRKRQISEYKAFEYEFWNKLLKIYHPRWVSSGAISNRTLFTPSAEVVTFFKDPKPMQSRGELVKELKEEMLAGFISRFDAMKRLNPDLDDDEIQDMIEKIDAEITTVFSQEDQNAEEQGSDTDISESA